MSCNPKTCSHCIKAELCGLCIYYEQVAIRNKMQENESLLERITKNEKAIKEKNESLNNMAARIRTQLNEISTLHSIIDERNNRIRQMEAALKLEAMWSKHTCTEGLQFPNGKVYCRDCGEPIEDTKGARLNKVGNLGRGAI